MTTAQTNVRPGAPAPASSPHRFQSYPFQETYLKNKQTNTMQKLAYVLACLLLSLTGYAQQRITGHVVKSVTREPLGGVSVTSKTGTTTTDSTGKFSLMATAGENL